MNNLHGPEFVVSHRDQCGQGVRFGHGGTLQLRKCENRDLDRENAALRELVTVYRYLSGLALQDADLAGVVRLISDRTSATVAVLTQLMDVLTAAAPGVSAEKAAADVREHMVHPRLGQVLRASRLSQRALRLPKVGGMPAIIVAPILVGDEVPSYLVTIDPAENLFGEDMSLLVTEHAATICGVILGRERVVAAAARRVRDDLVEGLLLGRGRDNADAGRWAAHLGYDPARDHNVLAIAFDLPARGGRAPGQYGPAAEDLGEHRALRRDPGARGDRLGARVRGGRGRRRSGRARPE